MRSLLSFLLVLVSACTVGQSIPLTGTVAIQNSQYETGKRLFVEGASIRASFAKATTTDKQGQFALDFVGVKHGTPVRLSVSHSSLTVVNMREMDHVIVGRKDPIVVVMADPERLASAQRDLYGAAIKAIETQYAIHIAQLQDTNVAVHDRIQALSGVFVDSISVLGDAIDVLAASRASALSNAARLAQELAVVDLDRASASYVSAFDHFRNGRMDSVLLILDEHGLSSSYGLAVSQSKQGNEMIEQANLGIRQIVQSRMLKIDVLQTRFEIGSVLVQLELINGIHEKHPEIFDAVERALLLRKLAGTHRELANYDLAWSAAMTSHDMLVEALGPSHKEVASALARLGWIKYDMGDPTDGLTYTERAYAMSRTTMEESDLAMLEILIDLSALLNQQGEYDTALVHLQHAFDIALIHYPEPSEEVATVCQSLASTTSYLGQFHEGERWAKRAIWNMNLLTARGVPGMDLSIPYDQLGYAFDELGRYDSAAYFFEQSIALFVGMYGEDHTTVAQGLSNLGRVRSHQGRYTEALENYSRAVAIARATIGSDHPRLGVFLHNEAAMLDRMGKTKEAIERYDECIRIWSENYGPDHPNLGYAHNNKGGILGSIGEYAFAMVEYREAMRIRRLAHSGDHPRVANTLISIGSLYGNMMQLDSALFYVNAGLAMDQRIYGEAHLDVANDLSTKATIYHTMGNDSMALVWWTSSLEVYLAAVGADHPSVAEVKARMAQVTYDMGDKDASLLHATGSNRVERNPRAIWYAYRCLEDKGELEEALTLIVELATLWRKDPGPVTAVVTAETLMESLRGTATKLGRTDVLKEFGSE